MPENDIKIREIIKTMTLDEKIRLLSGKDVWHTEDFPHLGIPSISLYDGPHGLKKQYDDTLNLGSASSEAICYPTAVTLGSSWDRDLASRVGEAIGHEGLEQDVDIVLGPGVNMKRHPLCGRNFEYFSEDPYLAGELGAAFVQGIQGKGVGACVKHFAVNNQEYYRFISDSVVDHRTLREIYLRAFEIIVKKAQPWSIMAAYNRVNGTWCSEHGELLRGILREEWNYKGVVVSDWGAVNDRVEGILAGMDLEMPGGQNVHYEKIVHAMEKGILSEEKIDESVARILSLVEKTREKPHSGEMFSQERYHALAREAAAKSLVVLKNNDEILPLESGETIAVMGNFAREPRYQGNGSSMVQPFQVDIFFEELEKELPECKVEYIPCFTRDSLSMDEDLLDEAIEAAKRCTRVIVAAGLPPIYESEGFDRTDLNLPQGQNDLIETLSEVNQNIVVVLFNGSPVAMPWHGKVKGIVEAYLGGQGGGGGLAQVLSGRVNPSGKLAETFPLALEDTPAYNYFPGVPEQVEYREGIFIGYRYYDSVHKDVLFPFGHGLSYTTFQYGVPRLSSELLQPRGVTLSVVITNSGTREGAEVVQLYVHKKEGMVFSPEQELKGFEKINLQPGESKEVVFQLTEESFAFYHEKSNSWQVEGGEYEIRIGASSRDIRHRAVISVKSIFLPGEDDRSVLSFYKDLPEGELVVPPDVFTALLGRKLPVKENSKKLHENSPMGYMKKYIGGRIFFSLFYKMSLKMAGKDRTPVIEKILRTSMDETPFRSMVLLSNGLFSRGIMLFLINLLNGRPLKAVISLLKGK